MSPTDYTLGRTNRFNHIISSELDEFFLLFKEEDSEVSLWSTRLINRSPVLKIKPKTVNDP